MLDIKDCIEDSIAFRFSDMEAASLVVFFSLSSEEMSG